MQPALLRLCIALSVATVVVALLSSVPVLAALASVRSLLLVATIVCWGILFVFYSLRQEAPRKVVSTQGPGGDVLQIATLHALPAAYAKSQGGDFAQGEKLLRSGQYKDAAAAFLRAHEHTMHPACALNAGTALIYIADFDEARAALESGLLRARHLAIRSIEAALRTVLGVLEARQGNMAEALVHYEAAAVLFQQDGDGRGRGDALLNGANACVHRGDWQGARHMLSDAVRAHRRSGGLLGRANAQACRGYIQIECDEVEEALHSIDRATALYRQARSVSGQSHACMLRGNAHFKQLDLDAALAAYQEASSLCKQSGDSLGEASAKVNLGNVHFKQGEVAAALAAYEGALAVHERAGNLLGQARTLTNMGSALARLRRGDEALTALERARMLYERIGAKGRIVDMVDRLIARIKRPRR